MAPLPRVLCRRVEAGESLPTDTAAPFWQNIDPVGLKENVAGERPVQGTRIRTCWNDRYWRILFEADDAQPWATLTERDGPLWTEEVVEVFFDPFGDLESYFEVEINPLGTVVDLVLRRTQSGWRKDFAWQVDGLQTQARKVPGGWMAELAIPFAAVADGIPTPGTCWRVNFLRIDRPGGPGTEAELSAWSPTGLRNFHRAEYFGKMEFI